MTPSAEGVELPIVHARQTDSSLSSDNRREPTQGNARRQGRKWGFQESVFAGSVAGSTSRNIPSTPETSISDPATSPASRWAVARHRAPLTSTMPSGSNPPTAIPLSPMRPSRPIVLVENLARCTVGIASRKKKRAASTEGRTRYQRGSICPEPKTKNDPATWSITAPIDGEDEHSALLIGGRQQCPAGDGEGEGPPPHRKSDDAPAGEEEGNRRHTGCHTGTDGEELEGGDGEPDYQEEERRLGSGGKTPEAGGQTGLPEGHRLEGDTVLEWLQGLDGRPDLSAVSKVTPSRSWRYWRIEG